MTGEFSNNIRIAPSGDIYTTGFYRSDGASVAGVELPFVETMESYFAKFNSGGELEWVIPLYGEGLFDRTEAIEIDGDGNIYLLSTIQEEYNIGVQQTINIDPLNEIDIALMKFTPDGDLLWSSTYGGINSDLAYFMLLRNDDILLAGHFYESFTFGGEMLMSTNQGQDMFLASVDLSGNPQWIRQYGGPGLDRLYGIAEHANGDLVICGYCEDSWSFGASAINVTDDGRDMFIGRTDADGVPLWAIQADGGNFPIAALSVATDDDGNSYVASNFPGSLEIEDILLEDQGASQVFMARFDATGAVTGF